jgi:hypothetical protein
VEGYTTDTEESYDQGTREHIRPEPVKDRGRKDGRSPRNFIDIEAFRRLAKRGFDGRPKDVRDAKAGD